MLFARIKRSDPEKIFGIFMNGDTAAAVDGDVVRAKLVADLAAANLGVDFMFSTLATDVPLGVVSGKSIPINEYGYVQVYGYHPNVLAASGTVGAAAVTHANDKSCGDAADANYDPKLTIGYCIKAASGGRAGIFLKCM